MKEKQNKTELDKEFIATEEDPVVDEETALDREESPAWPHR